MLSLQQRIRRRAAAVQSRRRDSPCVGAFERHQAAYYAFEAALKTLGSVCVVQYAERGTHEELLVQGRLYKEIYDLQLKDQERLRRELLALGGIEERKDERWRRHAFAGAIPTGGVDTPM